LYDDASLGLTEVKQYQLASEYYRLFDQAKDSFRNSQNLNAYSMLKIDLDVEKKEREISLLSFQSNLQKETNRKNTLIFITVTSLLSSFIIISFLILLYVMRKKRMREVLFLKTEELAEQKYQNLFMDSQLKAMKEKIAGQEEERSRIARELHDGVASSIVSLKLGLQNREERDSSEETVNLNNKLGLILEEIRSISHNLLPPQFNEVNLIHVLNNYFNTLNRSGKQTYTLVVYQKSDWDFVRTEIQVEVYRIIQELCSNIMKHSNAGKVEIQLSLIDGQINLIIEDNGEPFDYKLNGIGYANIQKRVACFGGIFEKSSSLSETNSYLVQIPL
jgi:signal transduction histidine kinase